MTRSTTPARLAAASDHDRAASPPPRPPSQANDRPPLPRTEPTGPAIDRHLEQLPPDWTPTLWNDLPPRPALEGPLAVNDRITRASISGEGRLEGAEDIAPGLDGHIYTGTADGGIWRIATNRGGEARRIERVATVEGRPLGLDAYSKHILIAAVAQQGVMAVNTTDRQVVGPDRPPRRQPHLLPRRPVGRRRRHDLLQRGEHASTTRASRTTSSTGGPTAACCVTSRPPARPGSSPTTSTSPTASRSPRTSPTRSWRSRSARASRAYG